MAADERYYGEGGTDIILRQLCHALASRDPRRCDAAERVQGKPEKGSQMCRRLYLQSLLTADLAARAPAPETTTACAAWCNANPVPPTPKMVDEVCELLLSKDIDRACSRVSDFRGQGYSTRKCLWEFRSLLGDGDVCANWPRPASDVCVSGAAFHKAGGAASRCGGDPLCRVMAGEGAKACAALDSRLESLSCSPEARSVPARGTAAWSERLGDFDRRCVSARDDSVAALDSARRLLDEPDVKAAAPAPERRETLTRLENHQQELEAAFLAVGAGRRASSTSAPPSSYSGEWALYNTPAAKTGCCGGQGHKSVGQEQFLGSLLVDEAGRFIKFAHYGSVLGSIDLSTGRVTAALTDPLCGRGTLKGACAGFLSCAGSYSQAGGVPVDGESGSEAGSFRLVRPQ